VNPQNLYITDIVPTASIRFTCCTGFLCR